MKIRYTADGHEELEGMLQNFRDQERDKWENEALIAGSEVIEQAVSMLSTPRSKGNGRNRVFKNRLKRGHILDFVTHLDPKVIGVAKAIETGVNMDSGGYKRSYGFGYANPLEYGTSSMKAQPFLEPAFERMTETQLNAMMSVVREGLGL